MTTTQAPDRLARYREVVPDWEAFLDANQRSEPVTLRARRLLHHPSRVRQQLESRGFQVSLIPGLGDYLRIDSGPHSVAQTLEHWLGQFHIQQCVMALPSMALAPAPGDRVLDLCAAPGGKTAHLAELMEDRGCLVAVDPKEKRLRGLMANLFRLGHPNILVVASDGRELPGGARFDRVLVDAPCSAEGNFRRQEGSLPPCTDSFRRYVTHLQESLLRRAIALTRPGGTVVYSTCTFAPEENEAVLSRVLANAPVRMEPVDLDLPHDPGLSAWGDETFHPDVRHAWRVYPHHMDSGGLFMARLRRLPDDGEVSPSASDGWGPVPAGFPGEDLSEAQARITLARTLLETEYGFDAEWTRRVGWMVRAENIWLHTMGEWPVGTWKPSGGWRVVSLGLRAFREAGPGLETPSNAFLTRFADPRRGLLSPSASASFPSAGAYPAGSADLADPAEPADPSDSADPKPPEGEALAASRSGGAPGQRWKELDREELAVLLRREALPAGDLPTGPLVLVFRGQVLGRGMVGRAGLRLEVPKAQARRLQALLETETPLRRTQR